MSTGNPVPKPRIKYKKFDWFSGPDLPELISRFFSPDQKVELYIYLIIIAAIVGFVYQAYTVLQQYFSYETVTILTTEMPELLTAPGLTVCFAYAELINRRQVFKKYPNLKRKRPRSEDEWTKFFNDLSLTLELKDIFALTPNADVNTIIASCQWRVPTSPQLFESDLCDGILQVNKFYKQQYICYDITLVTQDGYHYRNIRNSLSSPGMFYEVRLSPKLPPTVSSIQLSLHQPDQLPRGNRIFPVMVLFGQTTQNTSEEGTTIEIIPPNKMHISYSQIFRKSLPPPFDTNCLDYMSMEFESQAACKDDCLTKGDLETFDKVPFTALTTIPWNKKQLTLIDETDKNEALMGTLRQRCIQSCSRDNCEDSMFMTDLTRTSTIVADGDPDAKFDDANKTSYIIEVNVNNKPTIKSTFTPSLSLPSFFIYLMSCFGVWFGMSLSSILSLRSAMTVYYDHKVVTKGRKSWIVRFCQWFDGPQSRI